MLFCGANSPEHHKGWWHDITHTHRYRNVDSWRKTQGNNINIIIWIMCSTVFSWASVPYILAPRVEMDRAVQHSEQSTVRTCAYVLFLLPRIHREAIKPRSQAKSQSMGSSLIDNSLEEDWKASFVKEIARATAEQNNIIICYLRLLCHWANVLKPEMFGIRGERRSNTSSHGLRVVVMARYVTWPI